MGVSTHEAMSSALSMGLRNKFRRGNGPLLVFVGRIVAEKGVEDLIKAVAILMPQFWDISALIIGEGQDRPMLESMTKTLGLSDRVKFTGWIEPDHVSAYLAAGDIYVGPSREASDGWIEAQGLSVIEAMSARIPVIATRTGGIVDSVRHGETGLLVDERAPGEIAQAVERLVKKPELANYLREQAYRLALNAFSRASSAQAFSDLFSRMIQAKRLQRPDNRVGM